MELEKQDQEFTQKTQFYNEVDFNINSGLSNIFEDILIPLSLYQSMSSIEYKALFQEIKEKNFEKYDDWKERNLYRLREHLFYNNISFDILNKINCTSINCKLLYYYIK